MVCVQIGKHYELLNYSEHGTTVDNVLYSCDFSDKRRLLATAQPAAAAAALAAPRHMVCVTHFSCNRLCEHTSPIEVCIDGKGHNWAQLQAK